ncbi:30S ribosomal protein S24e [Archaeoglobus neptunius]|uniref:30S ribosomal protein S24e n=1 Tax=Archaeoglobus neptunius TaxID=2798580 RepID=UPI001925D73F|nr:30S ribosomal protein S24e [Archaeoglobus neptunius]
MEVYVESERYNPLLRRREVYCRLSFEGKTPSRHDVRAKIAGLMNAEIERVVVDYIKTEFGKTEAKSYVKIYDTVDDLKSIEEDHIIERNLKASGEGEAGEEVSEEGA